MLSSTFHFNICRFLRIHFRLVSRSWLLCDSLLVVRRSVRRRFWRVDWPIRSRSGIVRSSCGVFPIWLIVIRSWSTRPRIRSPCRRSAINWPSGDLNWFPSNWLSSHFRSLVLVVRSSSGSCWS